LCYQSVPTLNFEINGNAESNTRSVTVALDRLIIYSLTYLLTYLSVTCVRAHDQLNCFGCKGKEVKTRRVISDPAGILTIMAAYCNIFINPLIYMLRYDVVKSSLIDWMRETAAKLRNHPPPTT